MTTQNKSDRQNEASLPIGVFDSGVGGLTVLREIAATLPNEDFIYFGDTARVPYGNRSPEIISRYTRQGASFLIKQNIKLLIIACHTACSTLALEGLQSELNIPIIGVIESGCSKLIRATRSKRTAILGTSSTIRSGVHKQRIKALAPEIEVFSVACPLFVPLIEEGLTEHPASQLIAHHYLAPLKEKQIDAALLACTHYPLLREPIQNALGSAVSLIESAQPTAWEAKILLEKKALLNPKNSRSHFTFYSSDDTEKFSRLTKAFFGHEAPEVFLLS